MSAPSHLENRANIAIFCSGFKLFYYNLLLSIDILTSQHQLWLVGISKTRNSQIEKQQRSIFPCCWQQKCFNSQDEMLTKAKNQPFIIILNGCKNPFLILLSIIPEPWPWIFLTTIDLPGDLWVVADLNILSQTQSPTLPLTSQTPASSPWTCLVAWIAGWPGSHQHLSPFPLVWVMGIAVLPAPPSLPAASPTGLVEYPRAAGSWQSLAVKQAAHTAVYWAPGDADG